MPTVNLNAKNVKTLTAKDGYRVDYFDAAAKIPGFGLRVFPSGHRTWFLMYRDSGNQQHRHPIGTYPAMPLATARTNARTVLQGIQTTEVDPASARKARRTALSFGDLATQYVEKYAIGPGGTKKPKKKSWAYDKSQLQRLAVPKWKNRPAFEITKRDCSHLYDAVAKKNGGITANRLRSVLSKLFRWAVSKDLLPADPMSGLQRTTDETPRTRHLSDTEILTFWNRVAEAEEDRTIRPQIALWLRLRLLTAQRGETVNLMKWANLDLTKSTVWEVPGPDMKGKKPHVVPLTPFVVRLLAAHREVSNPDHVFVLEGGRSQHIQSGILAVFEKTLDDFQLRDLRRTAATGMGRLGVPRPIISRVLGHVDRSVTGIYDQWEYLDEKREALTKWENHVVDVVMSIDLDAAFGDRKREVKS